MISLEEFLNNIAFCDIGAVLASVIAIASSLLGKHWFKEWIYSEKEYESKANLACETLVESHSTDLRLLLNKHIELDSNATDLTDLFHKYSQNIQMQMKQIYLIEGILVQARGAYNLLLYIMFLAIALFIMSVFAIVSKIDIFCWSIIIICIVLIVWQNMIILWLRQLKHLSNDKTKIGTLK